MPTVNYFKEGKVKGRVTLSVDNGGDSAVYSIRHALYSELGSPVRGSSLTDEELEVIICADREYRCMKKALAILAYADNNKRALYMKLMRAGFSSAEARSATEECLRLGYINEQSQLERLVIKEANTSLKGRAYIMAKLSSHGYNSSDISSTIDSLVESGEVDFVGNFRTLCQRCGASSDEERKKLKYKNGF